MYRANRTSCMVLAATVMDMPDLSLRAYFRSFVAYYAYAALYFVIGFSATTPYLSLVCPALRRYSLNVRAFADCARNSI